MTIANYAENKILDAVFNATAFSVTTPYIALHTADPGEAGTTAEVTGTLSVPRVSASFGAAASGAVTNDADVKFAAPSGGSLGTLTHISIWDASTAGNCLWSGPLGASQSVPAGVVFRIPSGSLTVSLD
jgi:hypothetical protein